MDVESGELVVMHSATVMVHYNKHDAVRVKQGGGPRQGGDSGSGQPCMAVRGFDAYVYHPPLSLAFFFFPILNMYVHVCVCACVRAWPSVVSMRMLCSHKP